MIMEKGVSKRGVFTVRTSALIGLTILAMAPLAVLRAQGQAATPLTAGSSSVPSRITQRIDETNRITLRGNTHPLARPQFDQGAVADSQPIHRMLLLLQRSSGQETALHALLDAQQSKTSGNYHQWLTPQQFGQQFGPSDADVQTVTGWLQSHGFQVTRVSAGKTVIEFSGNAGQVRGAFNTEIHRFVVNGQTHLANASDPQIPAALAPVVAGPVSLHNFPLKSYSHLRGTFARDKDTGQVEPLLTVSNGNGGTYFALGPADFAKIYNVPTAGNGNPNGGSGQTIAIVGDSEICTTNSPDFGSGCSSDDVLAFRNLFGLPNVAPACPAGSLSNGGPVCVILDGPDPGFNGDEIEGDLDTEWSSGISPEATIDFVTAEDTEATFGTDLAAEYIVDNNLAPVMSESFGSCEAAIGLDGNEFESALFEQAAAQGITVVVSAGDAGSAGCDDSDAAAPNAASYGANVNGLASTPYNVAAGGTDFDINLPTEASYASTYWNNSNNGTTAESAKSYIPEIPWNDTCAQSLTTPSSATGCSPPENGDYLLTVGGGGGQSNCLNAVASGSSFTCQNATFTGSNLVGYPKPSWQSGSAVTGASSTDGLRDLPDISLFAAAGIKSNSFYAICEADAGGSCLGPDYPFLGVGGTSSSAPSFAAIMAQVIASQGRQGNPDYVLYSLASKQITTPPSGGCNSTSSPNTSACTFYDITLGNNSVPCYVGSRNCVSSGGSYGIVENTSGAIAFDAGTGFDMATGLGSINVTNLINNWSSVAGSFTSTTTTLCLIASPGSTCSTPPAAVTITHGQTVNGSIHVLSGGNPIPVSNSPSKPETASLIGAGGNLPEGAAGADLFTSNNYVLSNDNIEPLTNGVAALQTDYLVGGTSYTVSAYYAGDGKYGASTSPGITVTVNPEPSTMTISPGLLNEIADTIANISGETVYYGDSIILRADVSGSISHQENGTGSVTFLDNGNSIGSFRLNTEGYAEDQTGPNIDGATNIAALGVGSHSITATYSGDNSYCPSPTVGTCTSGTSTAPTAVTFTIVAAPTITSVVGSTPNINASTSITVASGTSVTLNAIVDTASNSSASSGGSGGVSLSGTVTFTCSPAVTGCGPATPATSFISNSGTLDSEGFVAGVATLNIAPTASTSVTATFTPTGSNYGNSTSTSPAVITVSASSFTLAPLPATNTTINISAAGQSGSTPITVTSAGFSGNVTLSCVVAPTILSSVIDLPTCSFTSSNVVSLTGNGSNGQRTLVVSTTAASALAPTPQTKLPYGGPANRFLPVTATVLLGLSLLAFMAWGVPPRRLRGIALVGAAMVLALAAASCNGGGIGGAVTNGSNGSSGGGGTTTGTTVTTYAVTITATPSSGSAVQTVVYVNVN